MTARDVGNPTPTSPRHYSPLPPDSPVQRQYDDRAARIRAASNAGLSRSPPPRKKTQEDWHEDMARSAARARARRKSLPSFVQAPDVRPEDFRDSPEIRPTDTVGFNGVFGNKKPDIEEVEGEEPGNGAVGGEESNSDGDGAARNIPAAEPVATEKTPFAPSEPPVSYGGQFQMEDDKKANKFTQIFRKYLCCLR